MKKNRVRRSRQSMGSRRHGDDLRRACLYPQLDESGMQMVLSDQAEINNRIYVFPTSAIMENGKKISYASYISSLENSDCNAALERISERIDMDRIKRLIDETPGLTELQRAFYLTMIQERKEKILDRSMQMLLEKEETIAPEGRTMNWE